MACGTCKKCNQGVITPTCTTICDFLVSTDCVSLSKAYTCLDLEVGDKLTDMLDAINALPTWIAVEGIRTAEEIGDTAKYFIDCKNEVHLKGKVTFDDVTTIGTLNIELPAPSETRVLSINAKEEIDSNVFITPIRFIINTDGTTQISFDSNDVEGNPPTFELNFDGQSYFK